MVICPFPRIMGASCPAGGLWDRVGCGERAAPPAPPGLRTPAPSPDCETLIRRMLVVEPGKRITLAQIRQHRWMQAHPRPPPACPALSYSSNLGDYDEQVLGVMQTLGVDRQRTVEVSAAPALGEAFRGPRGRVRAAGALQSG